jgi:hypothetical protein
MLPAGPTSSEKGGAHERSLILTALCLFLAAHRALAALIFAPIPAVADGTGVDC